MTKKQNKKRALIASIMSMILCVSMLMGTTLAWFTSTATNKGNRIKAGELGVALLKWDGTEYKDISGGTGDIFSDAGENVLWEPGKTEVVFLQVKNTKDLALNYNIKLKITPDEGNIANLAEALTYALIPNMTAEQYNSANIASWNDILQVSNKETGPVPTTEITAAQNGALAEKDASDSFVLAVHMNETAGDIYQGQAITIDVEVVARQMMHESDSFGTFYDEYSEFPAEGETPITPPVEPDTPPVITYGEDVLVGIGDFEDNTLYPKENKLRNADYLWGKGTSEYKTGGWKEVPGIFINDGTAPSGDKYLTIDEDFGVYLWITDWFSSVIKAEENYTIKVWVKSEDPTKTIPVVRVLLGPGSNDAVTVDYEISDLTAGEWKEISIPIYEHEQNGNTEILPIELLGKDLGEEKATICFDNLRVLPTTISEAE